ncbi:hypothetical protein BUALT_Bualt07G0021300 [Buddleja alternifolia]|uniref:non-specific serine/threonine protein kinase n=1 Tax=Buddleja alternifolia TaxID=168488 RepID=A0AAV6XE84_9LAMI|nr:hypothetical protein BUALT_Bualt07G0021300 [Buddleja alternifolia]
MISPVLFILFLQLLLLPSSALDFLFNSFTTTAAAASNLTLINDARIEPPVVRLTNDSNQFSLGRAFYPSRIPFRSSNSSNVTTSFSTQFVFSILPDISTSPGFGLAFVLSATTSPPNAIAGQYLGLFGSATQSVAPLLAIEFDTGRNTEFNDPDGNHVGIDLNSILSVVTQTAGYYNASANFTFVPVDMRNGQNIHAWIEFDGPNSEINVTIAPVGLARPERTLLSFRNPVISNYVGTEMFIGFSASKTQWVEAQRVLAWSYSDVGVARDINVTGLPVFELENSGGASLSEGAIAGIVVGCVFAVVIALFLVYWFWWKRRKMEEDEIEDWEMEYWPHRYSYEELNLGTKGFSGEELLGSGGFGKVYKATLANNTEVAVKCVSHDSKQGMKEFMAEISSMGRLQHKNLVQMRGWCRKGNELMLVYDYMPNGSLNRWIFDKPKNLMNWEGRRRVLADVAEGLHYLHHGWDQVVVHRDIKSSNVLLDSDMRGRLGDFGLAKLYTHGEVPNTTRVVGTFGYLAPEMATTTSPTEASDVYSFGVVVLEVACGRRPLETKVENEDEEVLIDWVRQKYMEGRLMEAADKRIKGEYELEEMEAVLKLGLSCCHPDPTRRPSMREVIAVLIGEHAAMAPRDLLSELNPKESVNDRDEGGDNEEQKMMSQV